MPNTCACCASCAPFIVCGARLAQLAQGYISNAQKCARCANTQIPCADSSGNDTFNWKLFLTETIALMKRREYTHPLQSMCILDSISTSDPIPECPETPDPSKIHTIHTFERQCGHHFHQQRMIMVVNYCFVYHFSMKTSAIPDFVLRLSSVANKGFVKLIQARANETRFCSERFDITYDMTANPFRNDSFFSFEKRLKPLLKK